LIDGYIDGNNFIKNTIAQYKKPNTAAFNLYSQYLTNPYNIIFNQDQIAPSLKGTNAINQEFDLGIAMVRQSLSTSLVADKK